MPYAVPGAARHGYKAPQQSGDCLLDPPPQQWDSIWQSNLALKSRAPQNLAELRGLAQRELLEAARAHTRQYRDVTDSHAIPTGCLLSGHQPDLFHPGVWFKNFVLSRLGDRYSAPAVQLIIDNDLYRHSFVRVPTGSIEKPRIEHVAFDRIESPVPFELSKISDLDNFQSFAQRAAQAIKPFVTSPIVEQFWPRVRNEYRRTENVGQAFAAARHLSELEIGLNTLEVPLSIVCRSEAYSRFVASIIERIVEFNESYNRCLSEFRWRHRLRSRSHPVPDLDVKNSDFETPFWVWSQSAPVRRRLYARMSSGELVLHDRHLLKVSLKAGANLSEHLRQLAAEGVAIRPRALITTMFARLVLSDLFLHGIGGAVYDEVTDEIVRRFFGIEPPRFLTLTATLHLPMNSPDVSAADLARIDQEMRSLVYHPERFVTNLNGPTGDLIQAKRAWIEGDGPGADLRRRHQAITDINQQLTTLLSAHSAQLALSRQQIIADLQRATILRSREYSFILFPQSLGEQLKRLATKT